MNFSIVASSSFDKELKKLKKKYPSLKADVANFISILRDNPFAGVSIGNDCYKIRMAISSKSKGKRGGARVITCVKVIRQTIFLLSIYDKSDQDSIGDNELITLLEEAGLL